jgi:hypothetical protein
MFFKLSAVLISATVLPRFKSRRERKNAARCTVSAVSWKVNHECIICRQCFCCGRAEQCCIVAAPQLLTSACCGLLELPGTQHLTLAHRSQRCLVVFEHSNRVCSTQNILGHSQNTRLPLACSSVTSWTNSAARFWATST